MCSETEQLGVHFQDIAKRKGVEYLIWVSDQAN